MKKLLGNPAFVQVKKFYIGKKSNVEAAVIYLHNVANRQVIDEIILYPLMLYAEENLGKVKNKAVYLSEVYLPSSGTSIEHDLQTAAAAVKDGNTVLFLEDEDDFLVIQTQGGNFRQISDPPNEAAMRGARDGFIESLDINVNLIKRIIKDNNLSIEKFMVGRRSQTRLVILFIDDLVDQDIVEELRRRIRAIDVDFVTATGMIEQYIEEHPYSVFPQAFNSEKPDRIVANIMEGKIAILLDGTPTVLTVPAELPNFFSAVEDYYTRTIPAGFFRLLRYFAVFVVLFFPSIYLVLIKFNSELIPVQFIVPIVQSRSGISLTPFMEIVILELCVELLREGGLRLPTKIAQTLSIVGGIIIGDAAVKSNMVSPTTLLVVGITVVASFLIPNYDMSLSIRLLRFFILIIANVAGMLGISVGFIFLITHLSSLENFGVPYMTFYHSDMKDIFTRSPLWKMNQRPASSTGKNKTRQTDFRDPPEYTE